MEKLKVYYIDIEDEEEGVEKISFVYDPAFANHFECYSKANSNNEIVKYNIISDEERIVFGAIILADYKVIRHDDVRGWHYTTFTPQVIKKIMAKYLENKNIDKVNLHHQFDVEGIYMIESFIKDSNKGINPVGYESANNGSWFGSFKVKNDEVWQSIKNGEFRGFSIEIAHSYKDSKETIELDIDLNNNFNKIRMQKKEISLHDRIRRSRNFRKAYKNEFGKVPNSKKYGSVYTDKGELSYDGDLTITEDGPKEAMLFTEGNDPIPAPEGEYIVLDGPRAGEKIQVDSNSMIVSISDENNNDSGDDDSNLDSEGVKEVAEAVSEVIADEVVDIVEAKIEEIIEEAVQEVQDAIMNSDNFKTIIKNQDNINKSIEEIKKFMKIQPVKAEKEEEKYKKPETTFKDEFFSFRNNNN